MRNVLKTACERQYAFQTKAGNIGLSDWNSCEGQIEMLRKNTLSHSNFDTQIPRSARFVTTGKLIGGATLAAQNYGQRLKSEGEAEFLTWDRETLVQMLATDPRSLCGSPNSLLQILGCENEYLSFAELERHSRGWIRSACSTLNLRDSLEAAVIANHCRMQNRIDLASWTALLLLRSTFATAHEQMPLPDSARVALCTARAMFENYAGQLWTECQGKYLTPDDIIIADNNPAAYVTYPVRCMTIIEILSLLGWLYSDVRKDDRKALQIAEYISIFIEANAGASHPISDRWGISLVPAALLLSKYGHAKVLSSFIRATTKWIADRYEEGSLGLAGPHTTPKEEVEFLLGPPFEDVTISRRSESYNAVILLELACVLEDHEFYELARNEFMAVENLPSSY